LTFRNYYKTFRPQFGAPKMLRLGQGRNRGAKFPGHRMTAGGAKKS